MRPRAVSVAVVAAVSAAASGGGIEFEKVALPTTEGSRFTTVTIGPDGRLYAITRRGEIRRWPLNPDGTTGDPDILSALQDAVRSAQLVGGTSGFPDATRTAREHDSATLGADEDKTTDDDDSVDSPSHDADNDV